MLHLAQKSQYNQSPSTTRTHAYAHTTKAKVRSSHYHSIKIKYK